MKEAMIGVGTSETEGDADLRVRVEQFEIVIGADPGELNGLGYCGRCKGVDYNWTDLTREYLPDGLVDEEVYKEEDKKDRSGVSIDIDEIRAGLFAEYRREVAESECSACEGTGFEGGSWQLALEEWLNLASSGDISHGSNQHSQT